MISVTRSPFVEQPNGDLVCTITIPCAERAKALFGAPIRLGLTPGAPPAPKPAEPAREVSEFVVELPAADKPPAQAIGCTGKDESVVLEAVELVADWAHPSARHIRTIYEHRPFQDYAKEIGQVTDPFAAPMPVATRLLQHVTAGAKSREEALEKLGALMDAYALWAAQRSLPVWPESP